VLNPGRASTTTSRRLAKIFQRSPCCGESDGNLGNILPICRLRNSAQSFRPPSERDFATLTVSAWRYISDRFSAVSESYCGSVHASARRLVHCVRGRECPQAKVPTWCVEIANIAKLPSLLSKLDGFGLRDPWNDWRHCTLSCYRIGCSHWDLPSSPEIISYDYPTRPI
jgi:hypothetical protein